MARLLDQPVDSAIRIGKGAFPPRFGLVTNFEHYSVPTRSTDFTHLRDGFYRAVTGRLKLASQRGEVSEEESEVDSPHPAILTRVHVLIPPIDSTASRSVPPGLPRLLSKRRSTKGQQPLTPPSWVRRGSPC
jgi:hypothetical protein